MIPKPRTFRDQEWIDHIKDDYDWLTFTHTNDGESVDPAHVGRRGGGMGKKTHDFHVFALPHFLHQRQHTMPEKEFWQRVFDYHDWFLMEAVQAYCLVRYLKWKTGTESDLGLVDWVERKK